MRVQLVKEFCFEAAHRNPRAGAGAAQARLHGHSYKVEVVVSGEIEAHTGWLIDFGQIKEHFAPLYRALDHNSLEALDGIEDPTVSGVAAWLSRQLAPRLPMLERVDLSIVGDCAFQPVQLPPVPRSDVPPRLRFTFEAAHRLPNLPEGHKCRRMHGHSFRIELGAERVEDLRPLAAEIYEALDHRCLNEVPGLENATSERLSGWIWNRLAGKPGNVTMVVVQETCTARCVYRGE